MKSELWTKKTMVPFGISMVLMIVQQWSGVNVVIFNTVNIFLAAKISISSHLATNIVGVTQLVATARNIVLSDTYMISTKKGLLWQCPSSLLTKLDEGSC